jgi:hypothetical protein
MAARAAALASMLAAAGADAAGGHRLAFYVLLIAVPAAAIAGLDRFASAVDGDGERRQAVVCAVALALVVLSEALRGPHLPENAAPALATSALLVAVALLVAQALRGLVLVGLPAVRRSA